MFVLSGLLLFPQSFSAVDCKEDYLKLYLIKCAMKFLKHSYRHDKRFILTRSKKPNNQTASKGSEAIKQYVGKAIRTFAFWGPNQWLCAK